LLDKEFPIEVKYTDSFEEIQNYQRDKKGFAIFQSLIMISWAFFGLFYVNPALWHYSSGIFKDKEYHATLFWMFLQSWVDKPLSIPFSLDPLFLK